MSVSRVIFCTVSIRNVCTDVACFTLRNGVDIIYAVLVGCSVNSVAFVTALGVTCNLRDVATVSVITVARKVVLL